MKKMERCYCVGNQQRKVKSGRGGKERKNKDKHRRKECTQNGDEGREEGGAKNMARLHMNCSLFSSLTQTQKERSRGRKLRWFCSYLCNITLNHKLKTGRKNCMLKE